jgi:3'-phosphoadenosine 5'-phosphosulfate sulfotransferase (PAPS reductase)/FAD synthetase
MSEFSYLDALESEAIQILRDGIAEAEHPVLLFSGGKDSTVLAHLALRAFYPSSPPLPLLHIDSTWEFRDVIDFRNRLRSRTDLSSSSITMRMACSKALILLNMEISIHP